MRPKPSSGHSRKGRSANVTSQQQQPAAPAEVKKEAKAPPPAPAPSASPPAALNKYYSLATLCGLHVADNMDMPYELLLFAYSAVHLVLQHYNIYRTNLLEVEYYAFCFSLLALVRRVVWKALQHAYSSWQEDLDPPRKGGEAAKASPEQGVAVRVTFWAAAFVVLLLLTAYCGAVLIFRHRVSKALFVLAPLMLYFALPSRLKQDPPEKCLRFDWTQTVGRHDTSSDQKTPGSEDSVTFVVLTRNMVNRLLQSVLFASATNAYYVGILPMAFVSNDHLYYPPSRTAVLTLYVFCNTFLLISIRVSTLWLLHYVAYVHTYGCWKECKYLGNLDTIPPWRAGQSYKGGSLVRYHGHHACDPPSEKAAVPQANGVKVYRGLGFSNCCTPGDLSHAIAWLIFSSPFRLHSCLTVAQLVLSIILLVLAAHSVMWVTFCTMLVFNYGLLFLVLKTKRNARSNLRILSLLNRLKPSST
eukprot:Sspe_Gene.63022::Locus_35770_Transcript_1_1_Confidence_1.000_Length_1756::g.63022::m.63022